MNPNREDKIRRLIDSVYETATGDDSAWGEIYRAVCELVGAGPGSINFTDNRAGRFSFVANTNDPEFLDALNRRYWAISPFRRDWVRLKENETFNRLRDCPDDVFLASEFYNDLLAPRGIYQVAHHCLFIDGPLSGGITFTKPRTLGDFGESDYRALGQLVPHLRQGLRLRSRLGRIGFEKRLMTETLDRLSQGVVFVGPDLKVMYRNARAASILESGDGLRCERNGRLAATLPSDDVRLRQAVRAVLDPLGTELPAAGSSLCIGRVSAERPYSLTVAPLGLNFGDGPHAREAVLILISADDFELEGIERYLTGIHGLTRTETKVARKLAEGLSTARIADRLGIRESTVRTHLKRIFAKTSTSRQSELVKLILEARGRFV